MYNFDKRPAQTNGIMPFGVLERVLGNNLNLFVCLNVYGWCWCFCFKCLLLFCLQACSSGVFELRLKSFVNENGKDSAGHCCSGERTGACSAPCRTRFRVCLKHYQAKIDTTSPCTFGDVITPVLGDNTVNPEHTKLEGFNNPIRFNFDFTWPVSIFYHTVDEVRPSVYFRSSRKVFSFLTEEQCSCRMLRAKCCHQT